MAVVGRRRMLLRPPVSVMSILFEWRNDNCRVEDAAEVLDAGQVIFRAVKTKVCRLFAWYGK